jgi:hypothetical protein
MTHGHDMTEEFAAYAGPGGLSGDAPDPAASLVAADPSRKRCAPLIEKIGLRSEIAGRTLDHLASLLGDGVSNPWFALWQEHCGPYFDLDAAESLLDVDARAGARLFLAHSYCKILLTEFASLALGPRAGANRAESLYDWVNFPGSAELDALRRGLRRQIAAAADPSRLGAIDCSGFLAALYQEMFPPALRHLLGEYYTPSWLVAHALGRALSRHPETAGPVTILDPAAGSGSFLAHAITHLATARPLAPTTITGFDVNPLAVDFCRANTRLAASKSSGGRTSFNIRIHLADAVVDPPAVADGRAPGDGRTVLKHVLGTAFPRGRIDPADLAGAVRPFHMPLAVRKAFLETLRRYVSDAFAATDRTGAGIILGNPPWIAWDGLPRRYRDSAAPQWAASTLVVNTGWRAKVAAGKTEFSSLFVYRAAERHAAANAVMAFVLPLSLFQSHLSGAGFRTFRTTGGRHFALAALDDFSGVKVFPDAANRTSIGTFTVDRSRQFPIPYTTWSPADEGGGRLTGATCPGGPLAAADEGSPIVAFRPGLTQPEMTAGRSDYRARGGVNTGGANTILWLDVLARGDEVCQPGLVRVRNIGKSLRGSSPVITAEIETGAVWPLLRGADMRRWQAAPSKSILLLYSPEQPKKALPVASAQRRLPKAYAFASRFREQLEGRKEYHRWGGAGPFYEVYRIGPYTFSPVKVAWQHTGYREALNVSVVDDRGRRPAIPDQKVILIPFDDIDEAHYVCAVLSSSVTAALLDRYLGADASTHILDYIALRRFAPDDEDHRRLAALSVAAHQAAAAGGEVAPFETEIDAIVARLRRCRARRAD